MTFKEGKGGTELHTLYGQYTAKKVHLALYSLIGRASLAGENEAGGSWGQEVHILHINT